MRLHGFSCFSARPAWQSSCLRMLPRRLAYSPAWDGASQIALGTISISQVLSLGAHCCGRPNRELHRKAEKFKLWHLPSIGWRKPAKIGIHLKRVGRVLIRSARDGANPHSGSMPAARSAVPPYALLSGVPERESAGAPL